MARDILPCGQRLNSIVVTNMRCSLCDFDEDSLAYIHIGISLSDNGPLHHLCGRHIIESFMMTCRIPDFLIYPRWTMVNRLPCCLNAVHGSIAYAVALVINWDDHFIDVVSNKIDVSSPLEAELHGLLLVVALCKRYAWDEAHIYTDCQVLIKALEVRQCPLWHLSFLFESLIEMFE
ncbi:hypothetical protein F8388_015838 [Cannabis sativa]|uniref:RNase H type-1 domain-containing protein n=1 Tax=Cannabis sativa TaxID=3483 RepID=A0A7J6DSR5_CANSA|nr:hypothetical protein F8388_015838 [Cannabis sativa]